MELQFSKQVRHSAALRAAYNALTQETYGFSFEPWYQAGYWGDAHVPYTLFDGGRAVSNVSVNRMELLLDGQARSCVQLGTVMTGPAYRGREADYMPERGHLKWGHLEHLERRRSK